MNKFSATVLLSGIIHLYVLRNDIPMQAPKLGMDVDDFLTVYAFQGNILRFDLTIISDVI